MNTPTHTIHGLVPQHWTLVRRNVRHPRDGERGHLIRNRHTGIYCLLCYCTRSVPQEWARAQHAEIENEHLSS